MACKLNSRQKDKIRAAQLKDLYFLISWKDEDDLLDVLEHKMIKLMGDMDVLDVPDGQECSAIYDGKYYEATVIASGTYREMKALQNIKEDALEHEGGVLGDEGHKPLLDGTEDGTAVSPLSAEVSKLSTKPPRKKFKKDSNSEVDSMDGYSDSMDTSEDDAVPTIKDGVKTASKKASPKTPTPRKVGKPTSKQVVKTPKKMGATPKKKKITPKKRGPKGGTPRKKVTPRRSAAPTTNKARGKQAHLAMNVTSTKKAQERENSRATSFLLDKLSEHDNGDTNEVEESDGGTGHSSSHKELIHATPTSSSTRRAFSLPNYTPQYPDYGSYYDDMDSSYGGESSESPDQYTPLGYRRTSGYHRHQCSTYDCFSPYSSQYSSASGGDGNIREEMKELKSVLFGVTNQLQSLQNELLMKKKKKNRSKRDVSVASADSESSSRTPSGNRSSFVNPQIGAILGCPTGECIHLADFTQRDVISVEGVSTDASKLALNLIDVFFTKDILSTSLATRWEGRDLLNPEFIEGIRLHVNYKYPLGTREEASERWKKILKKVNDKCRNARNRKKLSIPPED